MCGAGQVAAFRTGVHQLARQRHGRLDAALEGLGAQFTHIGIGVVLGGQEQEAHLPSLFHFADGVLERAPGRRATGAIADDLPVYAYDQGKARFTGFEAELAARLTAPRAAWIMIPAAFVDDTVDQLAAHLEPGDVVIDGGNSYYRDDIRRSAAAAAKGIDYLDVGTSGGVWGLEVGYCTMVGGSAEAARLLATIK